MTGFPVAVQGRAWNNPGVSFTSRNQLQRPGPVLLDGVVFAAFGSRCDRATYQGWVVGVSESGTITQLWADVHVNGAATGMWQGGGALIADGPDTMLLSTGNGTEPSGPAMGADRPGQYGTPSHPQPGRRDRQGGPLRRRRQRQSQLRAGRSELGPSRTARACRSSPRPTPQPVVLRELGGYVYCYGAPSPLPLRRPARASRERR